MNAQLLRPSRLFFDASVFVAAAGSPIGGSALVLELCQRGYCQACTSRLVLREADRNIRSKLPEDALLRFYQILADLDMEIIDPPSPDEVMACSELIDSKDAHVLAGAGKGDVSFLLTLDRRHFMTEQILDADLSFEIMTPGDFLERFLDLLE